MYNERHWKYSNKSIPIKYKIVSFLFSALRATVLLLNDYLSLYYSNAGDKTILRPISNITYRAVNFP